MSPMTRVACDVGGTFTDLAICDPDGALRIFKSPTTISDGGIGGIEAAIEAAADEMKDGDVASLLAGIDQFVVATTKALNAVLEGKTPTIAFLTTAGHPDILTLREGGKLSIHPHAVYPAPLVPRRLTFEVPERIDSEGQVIRPLDDRQVRVLLESIPAEQIEAIAVCLLWSTVNGRHESQLAGAIEEMYPGLPYTLSHQVNPIIREYRRACATVIDASLKPLMTDFFTAIQTRLTARGLRGQILSATSAGTMLPLAEVTNAPVHSVHCGPSLAPTAGMVFEASTTDEPNPSLVVVDAGGTSFDVSFVREGEVSLTSEYWLGGRLTGHLMGLPAVDVTSIGSGGGSLATVDSAGLVRVGPESSGAEPGPACYGRGGTRATLTDAAITLGIIDPEYFLGGEFKLDLDRARDALAADIGEPLSLSTEDAAATILAIADQQMSDAIEETAINYGLDLTGSTIVAGGGSCGFSIDRIASELGCGRVVIPLAAAALSACGGAFADLASDLRTTVHTTTEDPDVELLRSTVERLDGKADRFLESLEGGEANREISYYLEARYVHQRWEIEIPLEPESLRSPDFTSWLKERFHREHDRLYGVNQPDAEIEVVALRVRPSVRGWDEGQIEAVRPDTGHAADQRRVYLEDGWVEARICRGDSLRPGQTIEGPAILEEPTTTILIRPGSKLSLASSSAYVLEPATLSRAGGTLETGGES